VEQITRFHLEIEKMENNATRNNKTLELSNH
jgi:hypothetical protein